MNLRKLIEKQATIEIIAEEETIPIRGNCSAIDPETDRRTEKWIERQLNDGNVWAWCTVTVRGTWRGLTAEDHLGACSYRDERDFRKGGYFEDMRNEVWRELTEQAQELVAAVGSTDLETDA